MSDTELNKKGLIPEYNILGSSLFDWFWNFKVPVKETLAHDVFGNTVPVVVVEMVEDVCPPDQLY